MRVAGGGGGWSAGWAEVEVGWWAPRAAAAILDVGSVAPAAAADRVIAAVG